MSVASIYFGLFSFVFLISLTGCATIASADMTATIAGSGPGSRPGSGSGSVVPVSLEQNEPINEMLLNHINSIKVSSAAIRIIRPKSHAVPLAKRRLLLRRDSNSTKPISNGAQVIVTQYFEE